jgi:hypothetical protein
MLDASFWVGSTIRHLRSGRWSTGERQNDVLHPAAQLRGQVQSFPMQEVRETDVAGAGNLAC